MAIFDITYVGDMPYLKLEGGTVTGATIFNSSVTANSGSITNNLAVGSINGVTVGSSPKFTDTTYSVATTSANGLLPALGGGTTNYLRADGAWAKPPGTTYSVATTSANGLMAAADKVAVNKIGSGTLNTTNKTIIPAINELLTKGSGSAVTFTGYGTNSGSRTVYTFNQPVLFFFIVTNGVTASSGVHGIYFPYESWHLIEATHSYIKSSSTGSVFTTNMDDCRLLKAQYTDYPTHWVARYSGSTTIGTAGVPTYLSGIAICKPGQSSYTVEIGGPDNITISGYYIPLT